MTIRQVLNRRAVVIDRCTAAFGLCVLYLATLQWGFGPTYGPCIIAPAALLLMIAMAFKGRCIDCPCCRKRLDHCLVRDEQKGFAILRLRPKWRTWFLLLFYALGSFFTPPSNYVVYVSYGLFGLVLTLEVLELILVGPQMNPGTETCPHCGIELDVEWGEYR